MLFSSSAGYLGWHVSGALHCASVSHLSANSGALPPVHMFPGVRHCLLPEIEEGDVLAWTRERIAPFKVPKSIDVIPELPRNSSGKILRRELRAPYWEGQERQVS